MDASTDGGGETGVDVKTDTTSPIDGGDGGLCSVAHTFCDDFDEGGVGARWDLLQPYGGTLAYTDAAVSPPNALEVTASASLDAGITAMVKHFISAASKIHLEMDLQTDCEAVSEVDLVDVIPSTAPNPYSSVDLLLWQHQDAGYIEVDYNATPVDAGTSANAPISVPFGGGYRHFIIQYDLVAQALTVTIDGVVEAKLDLPIAITPSTFDLSLGVLYHSKLGTTDCHVRVDNVVVDAL